MTQPVSVGYPDWGRYAARATKIYLNENIDTSSTEVERGRFYVGDVPYIRLNAEGAGDRHRIHLEFWSAASGGSVMGYSTVVMPASGNHYVSYPVLGPFLNVRIRSNTLVSTCDTMVSGLWAPSKSSHFDALSSIIISNSQALAAGAQATVTAEFVWPGLASYSLSGDSGPCRVVIRALNLAGVTTDIHRDNCPAAHDPGVGLVMLPNASVEAVVVNQHTASNTVRFTLVARDITPGM